MQDSQKREPKPPPRESNDAGEDTWADDQQDRRYYYDDAHGYEQFDPDTDDDAETGESSDDDRSVRR